jgi:hypothetical protein
VALTTQYDPIFRRYAGHLPVAFLRALAERESSMRPDLAMPGGSNSARGLLQVVGVVRDDYNRRFGTSYTANDLFDPDTNVKIAANLINQILVGYGKHPSKNMRANFANPEFVKLLVMGWNAGFSEAGGVGRVARYLEGQGEPVTHDAVFQHAGAAGAASTLSESDRHSWQQSVVNLYYLQPDWDATGVGIGVLLVAGALAYAAYRMMK